MTPAGDSPPILLRIRYDGAAFRGWQIQPEARTVQGEIEAALARIFGVPVRIHGAGRTDSGVHALGQTAHFFPPRPMPPEKIRAALNGILADDVRVLRAERKPPGFHARLSAAGKVYEYRIRVARIPDPLLRNYVAHVVPPFDDEAVRDALGRFVGRHDFRGFSVNPNRPVPDTVRTIRRAEMTRRGRLRRITFEGDGFLYRMVRSMVGTLLEVGRGRRSPEIVDRILESGDRGRAGETAPPQGLYMVRVIYPGVQRRRRAGAPLDRRRRFR